MDQLYERTKIQISVPRIPPDLLKKQLPPCLMRFGCAFLSVGASVQEHWLPFSLCLLTIPGTGLYGGVMLLGVCIAALLLWPLQIAAELIIAAILIRTAVWVFRGTPYMEYAFFLPVTASVIVAMTGGILMLTRQPAELLYYVLRIILTFGGSWLLHYMAEKPTREAVLILTGMLVLSACRIQLYGLSAAVLFSVLLTVYTAGTPSGLMMSAVCGIALDLTRCTSLPMTALLCGASLLSSLLVSQSALLAVAASPVFLILFLLLSPERNPGLFWTVLPGAAAALLLPDGLYQPPGNAEKRRTPPMLRMEQAAKTLTTLSAELQKELTVLPVTDPALVFDRAADRVCKHCSQYSLCWSGDYEAYEALSRVSGPMLSRGSVCRDDFPVSFLSRCRRTEALLSVINQELDAALFRRQFRHRLEEGRRLLAGQYQIFAAYLTTAVQRLSASDRRRSICIPVTGMATAERRGSAICGDHSAFFRTARHMLYILLCDGMGSGLDAMRESTGSVQLLQELLTSGFLPEDALQLLNSLYLMRDDGAFSTVDLLEANLSTGHVTLWKWGSAPSYLRQDGTVKKIGTALPPPGLEGTGRAERFQLSLGADDLLVLLSDGAAGAGTEEQIRTYGGTSPKELAARIVDQSIGEDDDRTAVVLKLQPVASQRQHTTNCA